jgi:hypothetical protein
MFGLRNASVDSGVSKSKSSSLRKRKLASKWACEYLEVRRLFATVSWITQGNGNWSVGSNWDTGTVPQPGDYVNINVPGLNIVVTYNDPATLQLNSLTNDEELVLAGAGGSIWTSGTFDGSGVIQNQSTLTISGSAEKILKDGETLGNSHNGIINVSGTGSIIGQVGATISNAGTFNVSSDMAITFPTGIGDGNFNNLAGGLFEKTGGGTGAGDMTEIGGAQGFTFNNDGDCQVLVGTLGLGDNVNTSYSHGTFEISGGAILEYLRGNADVTYLVVPGGYVFPGISGQGSVLLTGGAVTSFGHFNVLNVDIESGSLMLDQNTTDPGGSGQLGVTITGDAAPAGVVTTKAVQAGSITNLVIDGGTFGGDGGGTFGVPGPTTTFDTPPVAPATDFGNVVTESAAPQFTLVGGTYQLPAAIVSNSFNWVGGTISGTGRLVLDNTLVTDTIQSTEAKSIEGGFGIDLIGDPQITPEALIWTGSGTIDLGGGSYIWIHPSAEFWDQANGTFSGAGDPTGGTIFNSGNFLKEDGTGTTLFDAGVEFINHRDETTGPDNVTQVLYQNFSSPLVAQLDVQTGTVAFDGGSININDYTIAQGATLSYLGGDNLDGDEAFNDLNNTAKILGVNFQGTINFGDAAIFTADSLARLDVGTTNFGAGTYEFENLAGGAQVIHVGTFTGGTTGTIGGAGTLEIADTFLWNSGIFQGDGSGTSSLLVDPGATLTMNSGDYQTANQYSVDNRGTIQWGTSPGVLTIAGNFDQTSTGAFDASFANNQLDGLSISGTISLAGVLNLSVQSLTPVAGQSYFLIDNTGIAPITGTFSNYTEGEIFSLGTDIFKFSYVGGTGNDITLTSIVFPTVTILTPPVFTRALAGVTDLTFTVDLSTATNINISVNYSTSNGSAVAGTDYTRTAGVLTVIAGLTTATLTVPIIGTASVESARTFTMTLSNPQDCYLGTPSSAVATLVSVNGPPVLSFFTSAYVVDENAGFATIVVSTSNPAIASSVDYATVDGTAIAGAAYTATSGVLNFAVGVSQLTFNVPILDEGLTSGQKEFTIKLSNASGSGATVGAGDVAAVEILDNDGITPTLTISDATVTEPVSGQATAVFNLTLSAAYTQVISVQYATANGTATEGKYIAQTGTVTIQPGATTAQINVVVNSDFVQTTTETFTVTLSDPVNVTLTNPTATGTILSQVLTTVPLSAGHPFRYVDAFNARAVISLAGPGSGTITYLGLTQDDAKQIVLDGTTAGSVLTIGTNRGLTGVTNIIVNGPLKAINAPGVLVIGDVSVTGGLATLRLNSLLAGSAVNIGSGGGASLVNANFVSITNADITSALPFGTLHVTSWQNTAGGTGLIAPAARVISATKNFQANISLNGNLTSMNVRGILNGSVISVGGNINSLVAGIVSNTDILAGVDPGVLTLPTAAAQFANTSSLINRFAVTSKRPAAFSNTIIAAPIVGTVTLGQVVVSNSGTTFGVAGDSIARVTGKGTDAIKLTDSTLLASPFSDMDLQVHITT